MESEVDEAARWGKVLRVSVFTFLFVGPAFLITSVWTHDQRWAKTAVVVMAVAFLIILMIGMLLTDEKNKREKEARERAAQVQDKPFG